jgi:serine/threonine protein kinase
MSDLIGRTLLNRYRIDTFIGRGAMSEVYRVWDSQRVTYLAMKLLREELALDPIFIRRFGREGRILARLQHPNIVRFYSTEEEDSLVFILLDYIEGTTLQREIHAASRPMLPGQVLPILRPLCSALQYAHNQGAIHCDIKPANIMIHRSGNVLIADFGLARLAESSTITTLLGGGTPAYMAPEQFSREDPTPQTDLYALGVVLFEMLTGGKRPFTGESANTSGSLSDKIRWEHINQPAPSPQLFNPPISDPIAQVVLRCLEKVPAARYANASELLAAFEAAANSSNEQPLNPIFEAQSPADIISPASNVLPVSDAAPDLGHVPAQAAPRPLRWLMAALAVTVLFVAAAGLWLTSRLAASVPAATSVPSRTLVSSTITPPARASAQAGQRSPTPEFTIASPVREATYTVQEGDTLFHIASLFVGSSVDQLLALNPGLGSGTVLYVGQVLKVSGTPVTPAATLLVVKQPRVTPTDIPTGWIIYTVKEGDTLSAIASLNNLTLDQLATLNGISPDSPLLVGQVLTLGEAPLIPTAAPASTPISDTATPASTLIPDTATPTYTATVLPAYTATILPTFTPTIIVSSPIPTGTRTPTIIAATPQATAQSTPASP